ncbi:MAG: hypothetical protein LBD93_04335 [Treponema sp.]|jgi:hypothetical protein|nr:hypothetical protein [Treponema sp.]
MDYSTEPIDSEDLRAFVNKALECLRSSQYKDFEKSVKNIKNKPQSEMNEETKLFLETYGKEIANKETTGLFTLRA